MLNKQKYCVLICLLLLSSCATYKLNIADEVSDWEEKTPSNESAISHTMFLIGDGGNAELNKKLELTDILKSELAQYDENSSIIYLGDNIYPVGMPSKQKKEERTLAEHKLNVQLEMLDNFQGKIMFVPGNHDWAEYGLEGVLRQQKYIEKYLNKKRNNTTDDDDDDWEQFVFPGDGCGDPFVVELNDDVIAVLIDSQWWLQDWNQDQAINVGCEVKSRADFAFVFDDVVKKYKRKNCVVAMHHPLFSNGPHGGYYTAKQHLFPLTQFNKKLLFPVPIIGSIFCFIRGNIGVPQDIRNANYQAMKKDIMAALTKHGNYIVASGHEHTLQFIEKEEQQFIVSGAGSKENATKAGNGAKFGYGRMGVSKLEFYEDGSTWVTFLALSDDRSKLKVVYKEKIKDKFPVSEENVPTDFPLYEEKKDSITSQPTKNEFGKIGPLHKAFLGEHYSNYYAKEYPFKTFDLSTYNGGLTPIKRGGGNQTNSLRLEDKNGHEFVMRSLTKDASRVLPYPINKILGVQSLLEDNFMAAHPFAAFAVTKMAEASNIYHTNPCLAYIPKQPTLGIYNDTYGNDVYLFEERAGGNWDTLASFGNSEKIISTIHVVEKITEDCKYQIDQHYVVRSRLFDILIKDWDRHEDQWRWASFDTKDGTLYRPIPRDRDQAFSKYDGFINQVVHLVNPFMRQLQTYDDKIKNIKWVNWNAKYFDKSFTNEMTWADWKKEAEYIKENVTDEVIEQAFRDMPELSQDEEWEELIKITKSRRDQIVEFAKLAYEYNNKKVDVIGTAGRDLFKVERINDSTTQVKVFDLSKKGKKNDKFYDRTFDHRVTKEIDMYGLDGDDEFEIRGTVDKGIPIRIIGGLGEDKVKEKSAVKKGGKKTLVYDSSEEDNKLKLGEEGKDKTSTKVVENAYVRKSPHYDPDYTIPLPVLGYNQDDGLLIGADVTQYHYAFKKAPYAQKHRFIGTFATSPEALNFTYIGEFKSVLGKWDMVPELIWRGDRFSFNYFNFGNETINLNPDDLKFNRVRQSLLRLNVSLQQKILWDNGTFKIGSFIERSEIDPTAGRFITENSDVLPADLFEQKTYTGARASFNYESVDEKVNTHKGLIFNTFYDYEFRLDSDNFSFGKFGIDLTFYQPFDPKQNVVLATKVGYESINGDFDFFKAPTIGGLNSLRGFRNQRFYGDKAFYQSSDLRVKVLTSINKTIPFTLGLLGSFDYGRVWQNNVKSSEWHSSYGYGIYFIPVDFITLTFSNHVSTEDNRLLISVGHFF